MSPHLHVLPQPEGALLQSLLPSLEHARAACGTKIKWEEEGRGKAGTFTHGFTWPHKVIASLFFTDEETKAKRGQ